MWTDLGVELAKMRSDQWWGDVLFVLCCATTFVGAWYTLVTHQAQQERERRELGDLEDSLASRQGLGTPTMETDHDSDRREAARGAIDWSDAHPRPHGRHRA